MTRHEAVQALQTIRGAMRDEGFVVDGDNISTVFDRIAAVLSGPKPDPITGLVPCGCGGKAKIWPSEPTQFTKVITDYEVGCTECAMTTGWVRGKQEHAVKVWNTAMGWKGGAE